MGVGIGIILIALVVNGNSAPKVEGAVVSKAPERNYIETSDSNGDGVKDWQESLGNTQFATVDTPTSTSFANTDEPYEPPTTLTGKFSEAFFKDYLQGKIDGANYSDPSKFVATAVTAIEKNTRSRTHNRLELTVIPSSPESIRAYGNELAAIIQKNSIENESEAVILQKALTTSDPEKLKELEPISSVYDKIIIGALKINVPDVLANSHVAFLNACEAILTDIEAFRVAFDDPLYAMARAKNYEEDAQNLLTSFRSILSSLNQSGVTFFNDEPGSLFYIFETP